MGLHLRVPDPAGSRVGSLCRTRDADALWVFGKNVKSPTLKNEGSGTRKGHAVTRSVSIDSVSFQRVFISTEKSGRVGHPLTASLAPRPPLALRKGRSRTGGIY